jgi:hypothetical protein
VRRETLVTGQALLDLLEALLRELLLLRHPISCGECYASSISEVLSSLPARRTPNEGSLKRSRSACENGQRHSPVVYRGGMTFEDVLQYLQGTVGHRIEVHASPNLGDGGVHLAGIVSSVRPHSDRPDSSWYVQIGEEQANGFFVSPISFKDAGLSYSDPETLGLFVVFERDWQLIIDDVRIDWKDGLPARPA